MNCGEMTYEIPEGAYQYGYPQIPEVTPSHIIAVYRTHVVVYDGDYTNIANTDAIDRAYSKILNHPIYTELLKAGVYTKIVRQVEPVTEIVIYALLAYFTEDQLDQYEKNRMIDRLAGENDTTKY